MCKISFKKGKKTIQDFYGTTLNSKKGENIFLDTVDSIEGMKAIGSC